MSELVTFRSTGDGNDEQRDDEKNEPVITAHHCSSVPLPLPLLLMLMLMMMMALIALSRQVSMLSPMRCHPESR